MGRCGDGGFRDSFGHSKEGDFEIKESADVDVGAGFGGESVGTFRDDEPHTAVGVQVGGEKRVDAEKYFEYGFAHKRPEQRNEFVHEFYERDLYPLARFRIERFAFN